MRLIPRSLYERSPHECVEAVGNTGMKQFRHPLWGGLYIPREAEEHLRQFADSAVKQKLALVDAAREKGDANTYVFLHERPWRLQALLDAQDWTQSQLWFQCAGEVWVDSENPGVNENIWRYMIFNKEGSEHTMTAEEREVLKNLTAESVIVYRGADSQRRAKTGLSWTLDYDKAVWFARRFASIKNKMWVAKATIAPCKISALFRRRQEEEVVLAKPPLHATTTQIRKES